MLILDDLMEGKEGQDLNMTIKRALFSDVPVAIDDRIPEALTILTNLTRSAADRADLVDDIAARELFENECWHTDIIATAPWVATHYLKDPNSRATGCARWFPENYGKDEQKYLGWSHNSNKVSRSHFLTTEFFWQNRVTSLFEQFSKEDESQLVRALIALGFPAERVQQLQEACRGGMSNSLPDFVSPDSRVILFPDGCGDYVSITPLVDAGFQRWVHNLVQHSDIRCRPIFYSRPFQVSSFLGTCGGKLYCFHYPPKLGERDHNLEYLLDHWRFKKHLLNAWAIFHKENLSFLLQLTSNKLTVETEKQRQERRKNEMAWLVQFVEELFSFLFILRSHCLADQSQVSKILGETQELSLVQGDLNEAGQAVEYFLSQINTLFERSQYSAQLAYHPVLLPLFEQAIKKTLNKITSPATVPNMSGRFLHFKRLLAYNANARSNPYIIGLPSLTAWAGLVHAFLCNLGYECDRTDFRFAVVLRKYALNEGRPAPAQEVRDGRLVNSPVIDHRSCDLEFDLIIQIPPSKEEKDLREDNLFGCLPSRFAGGTLTNPVEGVYGQCDLYRECNVHESMEDLSRAFAGLPSYARAISAVCNNPEKDELLALLSQSKMFPIGSGFRFLGKPQTRAGVGDYRHAFSTSVISVITLTPVHQINPLERGFWSMTYSDAGIEISVKEVADDKFV